MTFQEGCGIVGGRSTSSGLAGSGSSGGRYHAFSAKAADTHYFAADDEKGVAAAWFREHSNNEELIREAADSPYGREAFDHWTTGYFMGGQQYRGWDGMSREDQMLTQIYDSYLDRSVMHEAVEIRRLATPELLGLGRAQPSIEDIRRLAGQIVTSGGDMSCAAAGEGLTISWSKNPRAVGKHIEYNFRIPKGTKGAGMWIGDRRINPSWSDQQREFMMNRDTAWKVGKVRYDSRRECYVVDMDWVGLQKHDYGRSGKPHDLPATESRSRSTRSTGGTRRRRSLPDFD